MDKLKWLLGVYLGLLLISSCREKAQVVIEKKDSSLVGDKNLVKIYFDNKKYKIYRAYFDCVAEDKVVDQETHRIENCFKQLKVVNDTVRISFTPKNVGFKEFKNISIVYGYKDEIYTYDTSFVCKIVDR